VFYFGNGLQESICVLGPLIVIAFLVDLIVYRPPIRDQALVLRGQTFVAFPQLSRLACDSRSNMGLGARLVMTSLCRVAQLLVCLVAICLLSYAQGNIRTVRMDTKPNSSLKKDQRAILQVQSRHPVPLRLVPDPRAQCGALRRGALEGKGTQVLVPQKNRAMKF
jgi:hypothetical protein